MFGHPDETLSLVFDTLLEILVPKALSYPVIDQKFIQGESLYGHLKGSGRWQCKTYE